MTLFHCGKTFIVFNINDLRGSPVLAGTVRVLRQLSEPVCSDRIGDESQYRGGGGGGGGRRIFFGRVMLSIVYVCFYIYMPLCMYV